MTRGLLPDLPADAIAQWYADGPSDNRDQRFLDTVIIGPRVGACFDCTWRRVRAEYEFWEVVDGEQALRDIGAGESERLWPYCSCALLCEPCVADRRAVPHDPDIRTVLIRPVRW